MSRRARYLDKCCLYGLGLALMMIGIGIGEADVFFSRKVE